jgi:hypothetical protein
MTTLSSEARDILRNAGWTEDRALDVRQIESQYASAGHALNSYAVEFLRQYGNLVIKLPEKNRTLRTGLRDCRFVIDEAIECPRPWIEAWERMIGRQLVRIGRADAYYWEILCADDGRVFKACESLVFVLGEDGNDAINALVDARELQQIEESEGVWP